ncbi:MAG: molybdopterin-dependent oxidoreductase [Rhodospirillaceae bacterium]
MTIDRIWVGAARAAVALALAGALTGTAQALPTTTEFLLAGQVYNSGTIDLAALQALPVVTQTVTYRNGGTPVTATFTGATIWALLGQAGIVTDPSVKNDVLGKYLVATGSDGYRAVLSLGEIDPRFGGGGTPKLVAYQVGGQPLGDSGFARLTVPGDDAGGRYVSNLASIAVFDAPRTAAATGGGPSSAFTVGGEVQAPATITLGDVEALASVTQTVTYKSGGSPVTATFTGVPLWALLTQAGLVTDPAVRNDVLGLYLVATGGDGYRAVFALGELDPRFGGGGDPIMVAYRQDGQPLDADGFARLVVPGDDAGGHVSNLVSLQVFRAASIPSPGAAVALIGAVAFAALRCRRRRVR